MEQAEILRRILTELNYLKETTMVLVEGQQKLDVKIDIVKQELTAEIDNVKQELIKEIKTHGGYILEDVERVSNKIDKVIEKNKLAV